MLRYLTQKRLDMLHQPTNRGAEATANAYCVNDTHGITVSRIRIAGIAWSRGDSQCIFYRDRRPAALDVVDTVDVDRLLPPIGAGLGEGEGVLLGSGRDPVLDVEPPKKD